MSNDDKNKKDNKHFFKDFKAELKRVIWPTPKQVINSTLAVIAIVIVVATIVFVLDLCFDGINTYAINKLKTVVSAPENTVDNSVEDTDSGMDIDINGIDITDDGTVDDTSNDENTTVEDDVNNTIE